MGRRYTEEEVAKIRELYEAGVKLADIGREVNRAPTAIATLANTKGFNRGNARAKRTKWTDDMVDLLRKLYPDNEWSILDISEKLGVSENAVLHKASSLGLKRRGNLPDAVVAEFTRLYMEGKMSATRAAEVVGLPARRGESLKRRLGLKRPNLRVSWDGNNIAKLKRLYLEERWRAEDIAKHFGVTETGLWKQINRLGLKRPLRHISEGEVND